MAYLAEIFLSAHLSWVYGGAVNASTNGGLKYPAELAEIHSIALLVLQNLFQKARSI